MNIIREIKFRAWDKKYSTMHQQESTSYVSFEGDVESHCFADYEEWMQEEKWELMQFTGLKDNNGKEIYEGDIIRFSYSTGYSYPTVIGIVEFGDYCAGTNDCSDFNAVGFFVNQYTGCNGQEWNMHHDEIIKGCVIGNIYENPELLDE